MTLMMTFPSNPPAAGRNVPPIESPGDNGCWHSNSLTGESHSWPPCCLNRLFRWACHRGRGYKVSRGWHKINAHVQKGNCPSIVYCIFDRPMIRSESAMKIITCNNRPFSSAYNSDVVLKIQFSGKCTCFSSWGCFFFHPKGFCSVEFYMSCELLSRKRSNVHPWVGCCSFISLTSSPY